MFGSLGPEVVEKDMLMERRRAVVARSGSGSGLLYGSSGRLRSFRNAESKAGGVDERVGKSATWLLLLIVAEREREDERDRGDGRKKRSGIEFVVYEASNSHHSKLRSNTW